MKLWLLLDDIQIGFIFLQWDWFKILDPGVKLQSTRTDSSCCLFPKTFSLHYFSKLQHYSHNIVTFFFNITTILVIFIYSLFILIVINCLCQLCRTSDSSILLSEPLRGACSRLTAIIWELLLSDSLHLCLSLFLSSLHIHRSKLPAVSQHLRWHEVLLSLLLQIFLGSKE